MQIYVICDIIKICVTQSLALRHKKEEEKPKKEWEASYPSEGLFVPIYTENVSEEIQTFVAEKLAEYEDGKVDLTMLF